MDTRRLDRPGHTRRDPPPQEREDRVIATWRTNSLAENGPAHRWIRRLSRFASFTPEDHQVLEEVAANTRHLGIAEDLVKLGDPADRLFVVLEGVACQHRLLPDGRRQIVAYLFAGDMSDPRQLLLGRVDYSMCLIWPSEVATLTASAVQRLNLHPNIARSIARYASVQQAITREWLVNVGHRTAVERLGHLICEAYVRLEAVGLTREHAFELPLTQAELGDTLALSAVHVNRTLMELRRRKLVTFQNRHVVIHDYPALQAAAGFDPAYLQLHE
jgi:CRP-like cAMP-binding protein